MALVRMDIHTVVTSNGPLASLVVLRPHAPQVGSPIELPIRIGNFEAAAISMGVGEQPKARPKAHDLLADTIRKLGATLTGVAIVDARGTTFFAQLMLTTAEGRAVTVDSRPSDAIALAVRMHAPILAEESVLSMATLPNFKEVEEGANAAELERFHSFVEGLTPADFE